MQVYWRKTPQTRNSYAVLSAACAESGIELVPVRRPCSKITCYSLNSIEWPNLREEIQGARCITIAGGPHATACSTDVLNYANFVVCGEGEYSLPSLLHHIDKELEGLVPGTASPREYLPANSSVFLGGYKPFCHVKGYIEISRGCPHQCGYCATPKLFGRNMRHRPVDQIVSFARHHRHPRFLSPNALAYGSDGVTPRIEKVRFLLENLKKSGNNPYFGTFPSEIRPEFVTDNALDIITSYCSNDKIHIGAQSGSDKILSYLKRGHNLDSVLSAVETIRDWGLKPIVDIILGIPGETSSDEEETLSLIHFIVRNGSVHLHKFTPLPGTRLSRNMPGKISLRLQREIGRLARSGKVTGSLEDSEIRFSSGVFNHIS